MSDSVLRENIAVKLLNEEKKFLDWATKLEAQGMDIEYDLGLFVCACALLGIRSKGDAISVPWQVYYHEKGADALAFVKVKDELIEDVGFVEASVDEVSIKILNAMNRFDEWQKKLRELSIHVNYEDDMFPIVVELLGFPSDYHDILHVQFVRNGAVRLVNDKEKLRRLYQ